MTVHLDFFLPMGGSVNGSAVKSLGGGRDSVNSGDFDDGRSAGCWLIVLGADSGGAAPSG